MPSRKSCALLFLPAPAILALLLLPTRAGAQCTPGVQEFQNIAFQASNPLVAEYATTSTSTLSTPTATVTHGGLKSLARDSQGRVRVVRSAGKYTVKNPNGEEAEVERLSTVICDPAASYTMMVLDNANKTATVYARKGATRWTFKPDQGQGESFCTRLFATRERSPRNQVEDLGHQQISGYDTVGIRIHVAPLGATGASFSQELWCSDDLGAVLQQSSSSESRAGKGFKNESTIQNIERREPEPSLFQIPYDYTVLERAGDLRALRPFNPPATPNNPK